MIRAPYVSPISQNIGGHRPTNSARAPALPEEISLEEIQTHDDGVGPLVHRIYRTRIVGSVMTPESLMERLKQDLDCVAPSEFATFQKAEGDTPLALGDEYVVRMPGPWDGPCA